MRKISAVLLLAVLFLPLPTAASGAACEAVIWGNRVAADGAAAAALVASGMVDPNTDAGRAWLNDLNAALADSAAKLEAIMSAIPPAGARGQGRQPQPRK